MYGLAVVEVMTLSGHLSNIDEIYPITDFVSSFPCHSHSAPSNVHLLAVSKAKG